jgi:LYR motif-containing protein 4
VPSRRPRASLLPAAMPPPSPITRQHLLSLYTQFLRASNSFASYNFRHYFVRHTRHKFRVELPQLLGVQSSISGSSKYEPTPESVEKLRAWWNGAEKDLAQLKRSAVVNGMYQAPRLVVEGRGKVMTSGGGGAGMEQS